MQVPEIGEHVVMVPCKRQQAYVQKGRVTCLLKFLFETFSFPRGSWHLSSSGFRGFRCGQNSWERIARICVLKGHSVVICGVPHGESLDATEKQAYFCAYLVFTAVPGLAGRIKCPNHVFGGQTPPNPELAPAPKAQPEPEPTCEWCGSVKHRVIDFHRHTQADSSRLEQGAQSSNSSRWWSIYECSDVSRAIRASEITTLSWGSDHLTSDLM